MEEFVVKAKHWQIFVTLLIPSILYSVIPDFSFTVSQVKLIFMVIAFYSWLYLVGKSLNRCIPRRYALDDLFMTINFFVLCIGYTALAILSEPGVYISFDGVFFLVFLYFIFSFFYMFYFAAKALTSAEVGRRTSFGEHFGEMILFMMGIVGVWFLQPRINKVYENNLEVFEDEEE